MDAFDRALWIALQKSKSPRHIPRYVTDLLRSWSLVLRAGDSRLGGDEHLELSSEEIRWLCKPIRIDPPGVPVIAAARRFGVGVNTIHRWAKQGLVRIQHYQREPSDEFMRADGTRRTLRGADYHWPVAKKFPLLNHALVTTDGHLSPGGECIRGRGPWGELRRMIVEKVPDDVVFIHDRARIQMAAQGSQWQWRCKWCGRYVFKLYWPMSFTPGQSDSAAPGFLVPPGWKTGVGGFMCRHCADIAYESADHRQNLMERFCRRISGGRFGWCEVSELMRNDDLA